MARNKAFDKDEALEAAMLLFWKNGYADTSIQALEKAMKLKRSSIYNTFGNKRTLFQQTLIRYLEIVLMRFIFALEQGDTVKQSIKNILNEVINLHFNPDYPGGCMVVLSVLENYQHDKETNIMLDSAIKQLQEAVVVRLKRGEEEGEFSHPVKHQDIANQVVALITGMIVMAKANFAKKQLQSLIDSTIQLMFIQYTR